MVKIRCSEREQSMTANEKDNLYPQSGYEQTQGEQQE